MPLVPVFPLPAIKRRLPGREVTDEEQRPPVILPPIQPPTPGGFGVPATAFGLLQPPSHQPGVIKQLGRGFIGETKALVPGPRLPTLEQRRLQVQLEKKLKELHPRLATMRPGTLGREDLAQQIHEAETVYAYVLGRSRVEPSSGAWETVGRLLAFPVLATGAGLFGGPAAATGLLAATAPAFAAPLAEPESPTWQQMMLPAMVAAPGIARAGIAGAKAVPAVARAVGRGIVETPAVREAVLGKAMPLRMAEEAPKGLDKPLNAVGKAAITRRLKHAEAELAQAKKDVANGRFSKEGLQNYQEKVDFLKGAQQRARAGLSEREVLELPPKPVAAAPAAKELFPEYAGPLEIRRWGFQGRDGWIVKGVNSQGQKIHSSFTTRKAAEAFKLKAETMPPAPAAAAKEELRKLEQQVGELLYAGNDLRLRQIADKLWRVTGTDKHGKPFTMQGPPGKLAVKLAQSDRLTKPFVAVPKPAAAPPAEVVAPRAARPLKAAPRAEVPRNLDAALRQFEIEQAQKRLPATEAEYIRQGMEAAEADAKAIGFALDKPYQRRELAEQYRKLKAQAPAAEMAGDAKLGSLVKLNEKGPTHQVVSNNGRRVELLDEQGRLQSITVTTRVIPVSPAAKPPSPIAPKVAPTPEAAPPVPVARAEAVAPALPTKPAVQAEAVAEAVPPVAIPEVAVPKAEAAAAPPSVAARAAAPPVVPPGGPPRALAAPAGPPPGIADALAFADTTIKANKPNLLGQLADIIPGVKQVRRAIYPKLALPEAQLRSWIGEEQVRSSLKTQYYGSRSAAEKELIAAFGEKALDGGKLSNKFLGTSDQAKYSATGTLLDIAQNPTLYELTEAQRAVLPKVHDLRVAEVQNINKVYGTDIGIFPVESGGMFLPNADVSKLAIEIAGSEQAAAVRGRTLTRVWKTGRERWESDPSFVPQTNVRTLFWGQDEAKAAAAGRKVFLEGVGGKTRLEVIQETHPKLAERMIGLRKRLTNLRRLAQDKSADVQQAVDDFLTSPFEPEDLTTLQAGLDVRVKRGRYLGADIKTLNAEIAKTRLEIRDMKPGWEVANLKPYVLVKEGVFRYFPVAEAKSLRNLLKTSDNPLLRFLWEWRNIQFNLDLGPITGQQMPLAALFHPVGMAKAFAGELKAAGPKGLVRAFSSKALAEDIGKEWAVWERYSRATGRPIVAATPEEFAGGILRRIPGFQKVNEGMFIAVTRAQKRIFVDYAAKLEKQGLAFDVADAIAADMATKVMPLVNPKYMGLSQARANLFQRVPTSLSFLLRPIELTSDAASGIIRLGTLHKPTPREKLALKAMATFTATVGSLSVMSNQWYAYRHGKDPMEAAWESLDPDNQKFMAVVFPNGAIMPIGGPFRSWIRAVAPRKVKGSPVPIPFAGLLRWMMGKPTPGISTQLQFYSRRDYAGRPIFTEDFPVNVLQGLAFEVEGIVPLTAGTPLEFWRTKQPWGELPLELGGQVLGQSIYYPTEPKPTGAGRMPTGPSMPRPAMLEGAGDSSGGSYNFGW